VGQPGYPPTGTAATKPGAAWLEREAAAIAGPVTSESFNLERIDTGEAFVEIDG
jgi:hypothetical protein